MGVGEKHSRMRLWGLCLSLAVFTAVTAKPAVQENSNHADLDLESEFIAELLTNLLVPAERQGRQIADEAEEEEVAEVAEPEAEGEALEDSEALAEAEKVEVSRFNNYIDAIYRRMNAALKAKLMDPMELNLDEKPKKNELKKAKSEKTRVLREALDEDDVDRMGKPARTEKKERKLSKEERLAEKKKRRERKKKKNDAKDNKKEMKENKKEAKEKKKEMKEKKMEMKAQKSKDSKEKKMESKRKRKNKVERESR